MLDDLPSPPNPETASLGEVYRQLIGALRARVLIGDLQPVFSVDVQETQAASLWGYRATRTAVERLNEALWSVCRSTPCSRRNSAATTLINSLECLDEWLARTGGVLDERARQTWTELLSTALEVLEGLSTPTPRRRPPPENHRSTPEPPQHPRTTAAAENHRTERDQRTDPDHPGQAPPGIRSRPAALPLYTSPHTMSRRTSVARLCNRPARAGLLTRGGDLVWLAVWCWPWAGWPSGGTEQRHHAPRLRRRTWRTSAGGNGRRPKPGTVVVLLDQDGPAVHLMP
ncbi:hypothetical protein QJS66_13220 [Kocuria rhizophila]|nr:hypothetical protein QJS66_13220 [Kocuria rhizophila]